MQWRVCAHCGLVWFSLSIDLWAPRPLENGQALHRRMEFVGSQDASAEALGGRREEEEHVDMTKLVGAWALGCDAR